MVIALALALAYPWVGAADAPREALAHRVPDPPGFARVPLPDGSFGAFLRDLPLEPPGTPVVSFHGETILQADDPRLAAVVAIDVGKRDLQQCADSIVRLHAEWRFARGDRDLSYRSAEGVPLPLGRYAAGERIVEADRTLRWVARARPQPITREVFRRWLDLVFAWANTGSLARDGTKVPLADLAPGDFFVVGGSPGHAVLVLDVARAADGKRRVLLGQGYMPAQSFHVLRAPDGSPWFPIDPAAGAIQTPIWPAPFPWSSLRRLPR